MFHTVNFSYFFLGCLISYHGYILQLSQHLTTIFRNHKTTFTVRFKVVFMQNRLPFKIRFLFSCSDRQSLHCKCSTLKGAIVWKCSELKGDGILWKCVPCWLHLFYIKEKILSKLVSVEIHKGWLFVDINNE